MKQSKTDCFYPQVPGGTPSGDGMYMGSSFSKSGSGMDGYKNVIKSKAGYRNSLVSANDGNVSHRSRLDPDLSSVEKVREYQTALQLFNAHNPDSIQPPTSYDDLRVGPFRSNYYFNWKEDTAEYDLMTTTMTQEEVLEREMEYVKNRLLDLKSYASQKGLISTKGTFEISKKRKIVGREGLNNSVTDQIHDIEVAEDEEEEYEDNEYLLRPIFDYQLQQPSEVMPMPIEHNQLFATSFLRSLDNAFHSYFVSIFANMNEEQSSSLKKTLMEKMSNFTSLSTDNLIITMPSLNKVKSIIEVYFNSILPKKYFDIVTKDEVMELASKSIMKDKNYQPNEINLETLCSLGIVSLVLLVAYEALITSATELSRTEKSSLEFLNENIDFLANNVRLIDDELKFRNHSSQSPLLLQFYVLEKFFLSISVTQDTFGALDNDEDIHLAKTLGINHLNNNEDKKAEATWIILLRNYFERKLFNGTLPVYSLNVNENSTKISDTLLKRNIHFYENVTNLLNYLMIRDVKLTSLEVDSLQKKVEESVSYDKLQHIDTPLFLLNDHGKWLLGTTSVLVTDYYKLLGIETEQALTSFEYFDMFETLLNNVKAIFTRSPLYYNDNRLQHFQYFYLKQSIKSLDIACSILFSIQERILILYESAEDGLTKAESDMEGKEQNLDILKRKKDTSKRVLDKLREALQKLELKLKEYCEQCNNRNLEANKLMRKLHLMYRFSKNPSIKRTDVDSSWKAFIRARIYDVDTEDYRKLLYIVESLSEKLMNEVIFKTKIKSDDKDETPSEEFFDESTVEDFFKSYY